MKRPKQVVEHKMRGEVRQNKVKNTTQHRAVRHNRGIRERQGTMKEKKKISHLGHRGTRHRMALTVTPGTVHYPLGLVVDTGGIGDGSGQADQPLR